MRPQTYRVELPDDERVQLLLLIRQGEVPARTILRAQYFYAPMRVPLTTRLLSPCT